MKKKLVEMEYKGYGAPGHVQGTVMRAVYKTNPLLYIINLLSMQRSLDTYQVKSLYGPRLQKQL
jgi:hypothetical protein